jgi:S-adenosyl-L-methionine hydrolase (adenosine-forming)
MAVIALLTDFGAADPYVAAMKAVIVSRCDASVIDLTHEIAPFDVFGAGWFLRTVTPHFSGETARPVVFVSVVDPGVGSPRRILLAVRKHHFYLAPDNGLLSLLPWSDWRMFSVENGAYFLPGGSMTFHGRDRFSPVAAALARGAAPEEMGPRIDPESIARLPYEQPSYGPDRAKGTVVAIDRFGNVVTDVESARIPGAARVEVGPEIITARATSYSEISAGAFFLTGSSGTIEVSVARGSAAEMLHVARFDRVEVHVGT